MASELAPNARPHRAVRMIVRVRSTVNGAGRTSSDTHDFDAELLEGSHGLIAGVGVSDQDVDISRFADAPIDNYAKFAAIHDSDAPASQFQHRAVQFRFVGIEATGAPSGVHAVGADKHGVDQHVFQ